MSQKPLSEQPAPGSFFDTTNIVVTAHTRAPRFVKTRLDDVPNSLTLMRSLGICPRGAFLTDLTIDDTTHDPRMLYGGIED